MKSKIKCEILWDIFIGKRPNGRKTESKNSPKHLPKWINCLSTKRKKIKAMFFFFFITKPLKYTIRSNSRAVNGNLKVLIVSASLCSSNILLSPWKCSLSLKFSRFISKFWNTEVWLADFCFGSFNLSPMRDSTETSSYKINMTDQLS